MRPRLPGLALFAVAIVAGCGGVSASLRDLRQDAGRVCRQTNQGFTRLPTLPRQSQVAPFLSAGTAMLASQLKRLRRLSPPHDVADVYQAALSGLAQELSALRGTLTAIHLGQDPATAFKALQRQLAPLESQVNNAWQALQISACVQ